MSMGKCSNSRDLLCDRNVHSRITNVLRTNSHNAKEVEYAGFPRYAKDATDPEIALMAVNEDRVVITADKTFTVIEEDDLDKKRYS